MPSLFETRFEDVAMPMFEDDFGMSVTLQVGTKTTETFTAIATDQEYDSIELETGLQIKVVSRDWLLPVESLVIDDATVKPRAGNTITDGSDIYKIVPVAGKPAVELQDGGYRYLVHSQRVTA